MEEQNIDWKKEALRYEALLEDIQEFEDWTEEEQQAYEVAIANL
ncbi:hypothetical protein Xen7305DRAFT_00008700 [Xenococcus sp. PCC 7305]|nr:hypothetical protein [Xenococcus sp. PCC 7305]ELS01168.1 hypothetical protein Xen7305DRAFT_00008700 [Xenococcus sp. PCC 7305]